MNHSVIVQPSGVKKAQPGISPGEPEVVVQLLEEWLKDTSDYDATVGPVVEAELSKDRVELRRDDTPRP
jgi:hypothetical protein